MKIHTGNQYGFAMLYGLVVLFLASISGLSLLYMAKKDNAASGDYSKMRSAAAAAKAGLMAFEGLCAKDPQLMTDVLNQYNKDHACKWLFGTVQSTKSENIIKVWSGKDAPAFSACITKFDPVSKLIQIEANGYGSVSGKKKTIGIYQMSGLEQKTGEASEYALYLGGEGRNLDEKTIIHGNVYMGGDFHQNGGDSLIINGNLKTGDGKDTISTDGIVVVNNGKAFFQSQLSYNGSFVINGAAGFMKYVKVGSKLHINGVSYFNNTNAGTAIDVFKNNVFHSGSLNTSKVTIASPGTITNLGSTIDIAAKLGMKSGPDASITVNIDAIPPTWIYELNNWTDINKLADSWSYLATIYKTQKDAGKLFNGFLVIKIPAGKGFSPKTTSKVNEKVIWIIENGVQCNTYWYSSGDNSNSFVYIKKGIFNNFGCQSGNFRGLIYAADSASVVYYIGDNNPIYGAVYHDKNKANSFQVNAAGNTLIIHYDRTILNELAATGVIKLSSGSSNVVEGDLVLNDNKIRLQSFGTYY